MVHEDVSVGLELFSGTLSNPGKFDFPTDRTKSATKESLTAFNNLIFSSIIDTAKFKLLYENYMIKTNK